ncbi:MAG TPA: 3-deoxy-D-manno-octulosonic acid transferase [Flavobacteriales bacterium]|nr:3-deoxy-D-manno-octulosonic acid transferase [Flavobacteriales bacterium]
MRLLYNIILTISENLLRVFGNFFGSKIKAFKEGQTDVFNHLRQCLKPEKEVIWVHVSSLGEYEQALPVIERLKKQYPDKQILLSFFSPSGYEVKKDKTPADCVVYLPIDTPKNTQKFVDLVKPKMVFFVKYDLWPNYLIKLQKEQIPTYLISGLFKDNHSFFKWYNKWLKNTLKSFNHFFVQDDLSKQVLEKHGFKNVTVTGDTRFDRVYYIAQENHHFDFVNDFKNNQKLLIAGSTWPKDETLLIQYINSSHQAFKTIIAPHEVDEAHVNQIYQQLDKKTIRYTDITDQTNLKDYDVIILNTIGLLNKLYKYADVVYIGNGFGKSIHNIQEPAVFGTPIITGPNIQKFNEAIDLANSGGLTVIKNYKELKNVLDNLWSDENLRHEKAQITKAYALENVGATQKIMDYINKNK